MIAFTSNQAISQSLFTPERISKTASFVIHDKIENVFPLFGPVREMEWAEGWNPQIIFCESNRVEEHMIFQTKGSGDEDRYTWAITQFNQKDHLIEYTVSTSNRIWFIRVVCEAVAGKTNVSVSYTYTGLNAKGNELNTTALTKMYANNLKDWQEAINYYLREGKQLTSQ